MADRGLNTPLLLRPHHGLCLLHFVGKGYSDAFTANLAEKVAHLHEHPDTKVKICTGADSICAHCPHRRGTACESSKPPRYDRAVLQYSGLEEGQQLTWSELQQKMRFVAHTHLQEICGDCEWYTLCAELETKMN